MSEFILSAFVFGLSGGLKPGPLGIIVIQQTLSRGLTYGIRASLAPIVTDGPIILMALLIFTQFKDVSLFLALLSFIGGLYLIKISIKICKIKEINVSKSLGAESSLMMAIKVNLLNPNPYLFWFTVGGAYLIRGNQLESSLFVIISIGTLVLSKMFIAYIASRFREFLDSHAYVWLMRILGALLFIFGIILLYKSAQIFL